MKLEAYIFFNGKTEEAIDFYKRAFDATETVRMATPQGKVGHAELRIGDSVIMIADETPNGFWYGEVDMETGRRTGTRYESLAAFFPAVLARSGDLDRAARFEDSAYKAWTTFGLEPEELDYSSMKVTEDGYNLRPEIIESAYYL